MTTRGPRRRDGTLSPSGTAARSYLAGGVRCLRPLGDTGAVRAESAGCLGPLSCAGRAEVLSHSIVD